MLASLLLAAGAAPDPAWQLQRERQRQQQQELEWARGERQENQMLQAFRGSPRLDDGLWGSPLLDFGLMQSALQPSLPIRRPDRAQQAKLDDARAKIRLEDFEQMAEIRRPSPDLPGLRKRHEPEPDTLPYDADQLL